MVSLRTVPVATIAISLLLLSAVPLRSDEPEKSSPPATALAQIPDEPIVGPSSTRGSSSARATSRVRPAGADSIITIPISPAHAPIAFSLTPINDPDLALGVVGTFNFEEALVAINPLDEDNVVVTSHRGMRRTTDGGTSYLPLETFPSLVGYGSDGDTGTTFDSQGRLFWTTLGYCSGCADDVVVAEIDPSNGTQIGTTINITNDTSGGDDKQYMAADRFPASPYTDNIYVAWTKFASTAEVFASASSDHGATWSTPLQISDSTSEGFVWPTGAGVASNGDVYVGYHAQVTFSGGSPDGTSGKIMLFRSTDGGASYTATAEPFPAGTADITFNVQSAAGKIPGLHFWIQGSAQPWILNDPNQAGTIYVIANDDPDNVHGTAGDDADVVFAKSTDYGATWTRSTIPDGSGGAHQIFPFAAIDQFGNIIVAWFDTRRAQTNANGNFLLDVFATYSTDGGSTWVTPFMVNDPNNPTDPDFPNNQRRFPTPQLTPCDASSTSTETCRIGEYFGVDMRSGLAHLAWIGNLRDGGGVVTGDQLFTSTVQLPIDLAVSTAESVDPVTAGSGSGNLVYTVTVTNNGPVDATGVELTDTLTLPAGVSTDSISPSAGSFAGTTWTVGTLAPAQSETLTVTLSVTGTTAPGSDVVCNLAEVSAVDQPDSDDANDSLSECTSVVSPADVIAVKTAPKRINSGENLVYTVTLQNLATAMQVNDPASDEFVDVLPAGLTLLTASASSGTATAVPATNTVRWNGSIAPGGTVTLTITAHVDLPAGNLVNQGSVFFDADGDGTNDTVRATDDPAFAGANDATATQVTPADVPALDPWAMIGFLVLLAGAAVIRLR